MPLVFKVVFSTAVITQIESIGGGCVGGGGGGWGAVGGVKQTLNSKGSALPSVSDPDRHNSQGRPGLPSESVWHPMQSY